MGLEEVDVPSSGVGQDETPLSRDSLVSVRLSEIKDSPEAAMDFLEVVKPRDEVEAADHSADEHQAEQLVEPDTHTDPELAAEPHDQSMVPSRSSTATSRTSTNSVTSLARSATPEVDWEELEKTEEQEPKDEGTDESAALLLARLEQENATLATDPKNGSVKSPRTPTRPPSIQHLKKLVDGPQRRSLRYSQLSAPPMTELEFWAALVSDYVQTAQRLPTLTSNKIRGGIPPPLRGVVWPSVAGAQDPLLLEEYQRLCGEQSPYEGQISKDVSRSFPNVQMFREPDGEGQRMLGRVLSCFSLYDEKIGYCQGLGFVVGPLLMHMNDAQAFCILVRLMEHYDLRSCYLPDLSGLHLRIYQFQQLLNQHFPELAAHLESLKVEPLYVSQWFLSFFAVTCPLPMLLRIYDVILSEGATETLMRVALSLMRRNTKKIIACTELEDIMHLLLSRSLWDAYAQQADDLVSDFVSMTSLVSRSTLQSLEESYKASQAAKTPSLKVTASQFLGRFWGGSTHGMSKSTNNLSLALPSRPTSSMQRSPSKQSLASTLNSYGSTSDASTAPTDASVTSRKSDPTTSDSASQLERVVSNHPDRDLHSQIEDLLTAMSDMQRQQNELLRDLQREREEREEDRNLAKNLFSQLKSQAAAAKELLGEDADSDDELSGLIDVAEARLSGDPSKRTSILQTKHQLRDSVADWRRKYEAEQSRSKELTERLDAQEQDHLQIKEQLREARARAQGGHKDRQRLERTVQDLKAQRSPVAGPPSELSFEPSGSRRDSTAVGLRELKLLRTPTSESMKTPQQQNFSKRTSSLSVQAILSTENNAPAPDDSLLLELVNAKTGEAVARQELEEVKAKLDALRKMLSLPSNSSAGAASGSGAPLSRSSTLTSDTTTSASPLPTPGVGGTAGTASLSLPRTPFNESPITRGSSPGSGLVGLAAGVGGSFFSGWSKRSFSSSVS